MLSNLNILSKNALFKDIKPESIEKIIDKERLFFVSYDKGTTISQEGSICKSIGFIAKGSMSIEQLLFCGDKVTISIYKTYDCFGEALIFGERNTYPYTFIAREQTDVIYLSKSIVIKLIERCPEFTKNYLSVLSEKLLMLKDKIEVLSEKDVRSKLMNYLVNESKTAGNSSFKLVHTKTQIGDFINVARGSVSREIRKMEIDGLITYKDNKITIIDTNN